METGVILTMRLGRTTITKWFRYASQAELAVENFESGHGTLDSWSIKVATLEQYNAVWGGPIVGV